MRQFVFNGYSREEIEDKIDRFLRTEQKHKPIELIMPVKGASKYSYEGFTIREWHHHGNVRFDTAVEIDE